MVRVRYSVLVLNKNSPPLTPLRNAKGYKLSYKTFLSVAEEVENIKTTDNFSQIVVVKETSGDCSGDYVKRTFNVRL